MVGDGALGRIEHVQMTRLSCGSRVPLRPWGWLFDRTLGGGWIGAWGSHAVDTLRSIFAAEVTEVQALLRRDVLERPDDRGDLHLCTAEDGFSASLVLSNGASVAIDSGFAAVANMAPRFTVFGSSSVAELSGETRISVRRADGSRESIDLADDDRADDAHLAPMRRFAEVVRDAVTSGEVPAHAPTFSDGRACDAVLDRLRASPFARRPMDEVGPCQWRRWSSEPLQNAMPARVLARQLARELARVLAGHLSRSLTKRLATTPFPATPRLV